MLHKRGPHEIALANTAVLMHLLRRLIDTKLLPREQALALLGNAADDLVTNGNKVTDVHIAAAEIIRKELVPKV